MDRRELTLLTAAAAIVPLIGWAYWVLVVRLGPNDFHDYWLAGRLLLEGHSPYDTGAMAELARKEGLSFLVGGGFSYPLPFAVAMVPLAVLPFGVAYAGFNAISIAAFALTVALWLRWAFGREPLLRRRRIAVAFAAGLYLPVYGSVAMGQANLILFPILGLGLVLALDGSTTARRLAGGALLGLASAVKLFPAAVALPLALGRRWSPALGLVAAAGLAVVGAAIVLPWAASGSSGLTSLLDADVYTTNQSINGFVTRLVVPSASTVPLWQNGFDARSVMLGLTVAFGLATALVLWRARHELNNRRGAALGIGLALVAAIVGAPKNSFWNESLALVAIGAMLTVETPNLDFGSFGRLDRALLAVWFGTSAVWAVVWAVTPSITVPLAPLVTLLWSSSLYGLLALWLLFVRRLGIAADLRGNPV